MAKAHTRNGGFTLIELLTVMAIMALLSTVVVSSYFGIMRGAATRAAGQHLKATIDFTRQRACTDGTSTYLWFLGSNAYAVCRQAGVVSEFEYPTYIIDYYTDLTVFEDTLSYAGTRVYNLDKDTRFEIRSDSSAGTSYRVKKNPTGGWMIPLKAIGSVSSPAWASGDRYGWEIQPRRTLPLGFVFEKDDYGYIRFDPDGSLATGSEDEIRIIEEVSGNETLVGVSKSGRVSIK